MLNAKFIADCCGAGLALVKGLNYMAVLFRFFNFINHKFALSFIKLLKFNIFIEAILA